MRASPDDAAARARASSPSHAAGPASRAELDRLLELAARDTGAHAGALFLLAPEGEALRLEVATGMPADFLAPWFGVGLSNHVPVADAVRERRLVWLSKPQEIAHRYPRTAIAMPYHFAAAAAPILTGSAAWGALLLIWPCCDTAEVPAPSHERVGAACRRLGRFLRDAADAGHPVTPRPTRGRRRSRPPRSGSRHRPWPRRSSRHACREAAAPLTSRAGSPTSARPRPACWAGPSPASSAGAPGRPCRGRPTPLSRTASGRPWSAGSRNPSQQWSRRAGGSRSSSTPMPPG